MGARVLLSSPPWDSLAYWALDLETGGLDPRHDPIIAVGMVPIRGGTLRLGEAYYSLARLEPGRSIDPASVRAHQLVLAELAHAPPLAEVLREIDRRVRDGVLLVHHRGLDVGFLKDAYRRSGMRWPRPPVVDTVDLLIRAKRRSPFVDPHLPAELPVLNLSRARRQYGLPDYQAHDALSDAIAAAELFLVLRHALGARRLRDLR
jgi:DNA polymerase-3 subunit epsilon